MHHRLPRYKLQQGATLLISLLLIAVLTLLSTTAMQGSHLSFKTQLSRIEFQRNVSDVSMVQNQAVKQIKAFIDDRKVPSVEQIGDLSDGFRLLEKLLMSRDIDSAEDEPSWMLSYSLPELRVDVYISHAWVETDYQSDELTQFKSYGQGAIDGRAMVARYLYLQVHCIAKPVSNQNQGDLRISGDYRINF